MKQIQDRIDATTIEELRINPEYQDLIQPLTKKEYELVKKSIQEQGQHVSIIVNTKGTVIDDHYWYTACQELGIIPKIEIRDFASSLDEKIGANLVTGDCMIF
jgi:hypothetical protein